MMIKVYILPIERSNNVDAVKGIKHIHHALLQYGYGNNQAMLIQDTTQEEDIALSEFAFEVREPTAQEIKSIQRQKEEMK